MSTATSDTAIDDAARYLQEVAPHLAALPPDERADLLEDLAQHLREIAAEPGPPLAERLGPPGAYAAELLASAGVDPVPPARGLPARAAALARRVRASSPVQETLRLAPGLRPAWWVARAYLAVSLLAALSRNGDYPGFPLPGLFGSDFLGLVAFLAAIPLSVRLGEATTGRAGRLVVGAATVVLLLYGVSLLDRAGEPEIRYVTADARPWSAAERGCLTDANGVPITNLYAYDAEGRLLDPVLLYDQDGRPIDNLCPEVDARGRRLSTEYRRDANGAPVINAFPRRQSALSFPGSTAPVPPPAVVVPRLAPSTTTTTTGPPAG